jgi:D-alanyl-lipoteichoic acid acyltransferase DltB (MBOAT superfamily)
MMFPTINFALFFLAVFFVSWALRDRPMGRKWFLVAASYLFYACWDWRFCFLLAGSSLINFAAGHFIAASTDSRRRKRLVTVAVVINIGTLGVFKYYTFFMLQLSGLLVGLGWQPNLPMLQIILPVAVSFFTFHGISYVVDVYRGKVPACRSVVDLLLYISFFPQLVAGPIIRASHFLPQLQRPADPSRIPVARSLLLIVIGLFKKVVVANLLSTQLVDPVFLDPSSHGPVELLFAAWGYALQIYCDFSAYTDIATGVAALLGYQFPKNFDQPYRASSIQDFWHRWHISLSTWLREYLYIPLGGNRGGALATYRNLLLTMFLGGLWHGAAWTFILWGVFHGTTLAAEKFIRSKLAPTMSLGPVLSVVLVFHFVCFTWIFFRAPGLDVAMDYLAAFAQWDAPIQHLTPFLAAVVVLGLASQFLPANLLDRLEAGASRLPLLAQGLTASFMIIAIDAFGPDGVAPFIYFQF